MPAQTDSISVDTTSGRSYLIQNVERNGEILPEIAIKEVTVVGRPTKEESRRSEYRKYERLIYNLKKVYPYAVIVRQRMDEVNTKLAGMNSDRSRREYIRQFEKDVFNEFEDDIKDMTITQGKLLIKLIDRETQNTSYELIKDYRGGLTAAFWQGIARIFGTNLKEEYDPFGNDALIEVILMEIEDGKL
ncbi:MAG TPA: DUF4294 domain-containing protein [Bacteroidales bacterium]|nr:DUF4294 domain-containing protein [Bacteroidales bacterium]